MERKGKGGGGTGEEKTRGKSMSYAICYKLQNGGIKEGGFLHPSTLSVFSTTEKSGV